MSDDCVNSDEYDIKPDNKNAVIIEEETQERQKYLSLERSKSRIWEHFGFLARDGKYCEPDKKKRRLVYCKVCECSYKYSENTTNIELFTGSTGLKFFNALNKPP